MLAAMPRLCVFDCDGTLVDSQHRIALAMARAMAAHDHPVPTSAEIRRVIGLTLVGAIAVLAPTLDRAGRDRVAASYTAAFADLRARGEVAEPLFPGTRESLRALESAGWLLGIATGKSLRGTLATLAAHELGELFVTLQTADHAAGKPAPEMMLRAMAETGAAPHETVMVGDTVFDIEMARSAGTRAIGVAWGYHAREELADAGADLVIERFADLPPALDRLVADG